MIGGSISTAQAPESVLVQDQFDATSFNAPAPVLSVNVPKNLIHRKIWLATGMVGSVSTSVIDAELQFILNNNVEFSLPYRLNTGRTVPTMCIGNNTGFGTTSNIYMYDEGVIVNYGTSAVGTCPWRLRSVCDEIRLYVHGVTIQTRWYGALIVMSSPIEV